LLLFASLALTQSCKKVDVNPNKTNSTSSENATASVSVDLRVVGDNFVSPLTVVDARDGIRRLFVVDQIGKIWIIDSNRTTLSTPFLDISNKLVTLNPDYDERGLLGLAFHPNFKTNGKFYVFYTAPRHPGGPEPGVHWDNMTTISEFKVSAGNSNVADASSERIVLNTEHPQFNHNGGTIAFGPDGYLYISIGDGGNYDDIGPGHVQDWYKTNAGGNGQDVRNNLLGNILRIDVDQTGSGAKAYGVPPDNPFVGQVGRDEIYAYGFRNPYRFSFDMGGDHALYVGDAGQSLYEEIDMVTKGGNYGWDVKEGKHCFNTDNDLVERAACPEVDSAGNPLIDPIIEVNNSENPKGGQAIAIVGGNVYRGNNIPELAGKYIFGFLSADEEEPEGKIVVGTPSGSGLWSYEELHPKKFPDDLGQWLKGFGQDQRGEIYVTTSKQLGPQGNTGRVYKIIAAQ